MPPLAALCPPATVIDKTRYSALAQPKLTEHLRQREADALIVSGSETDVCVLATVLDAVDIGYRVIVVRDAVCSSSDEGHDMLMRLYHTRYTEQIETADAATILTRWEYDLSLLASSRLRVLVDLALRELGERFVGLLFLSRASSPEASPPGSSRAPRPTF